MQPSKNPENGFSDPSKDSRGRARARRQICTPWPAFPDLLASIRCIIGSFYNVRIQWAASE